MREREAAEREREEGTTMASMGHQKTLKKQYSSAGSSNSRTRSSPLPEKRKDEPRDWRKALRSEGSAFTPWGEPSVDHLYHLDVADWQKQYDGVQHHAPRREGAFGIKTEYTSRSLGSERGTTLDPAESHLPL